MSSSLSGWTLAKYLLAFSGLGIVLLADRLGIPRLSYVGLALLAAAFALRFAQHRKATQRNDSPPSR